MSRTAFNLAVDLAAAALFVGMVATGFLIAFVLPPGTNRSLILWGLTRHEWGNVHLWVSFGLLAAVLLHVCLHWQWVVSTIGKRLGLASPKGNLLRTGLPVLLVLAAVLSLFAWASWAGVRKIEDPESHGVCPAPAPVVVTARQTVPPSAQSEKHHAPANFWEEVYPVLERACLSCHGPRRQAAGFRIDRREDYFGGDGRAPLVVPGDSAGSPLIAIVSGQRKDMARADAHRLSDPEVALLRSWIDAGARWPEEKSGGK